MQYINHFFRKWVKPLHIILVIQKDSCLSRNIPNGPILQTRAVIVVQLTGFHL